MEFKSLLPFLEKLADANKDVSVQEVATQLHKQLTNREEDNDGETVDNEVTDDGQSDHKPSNEEGEMLENSFQELKVEDAIEKAKEEKALEGNDSGLSNEFKKAASIWDELKCTYERRNDCR